MLWDLYLELSDRSDRCASPSLRQNLTIRRLIGNWNGARVQKNDQMQHRRRCECVSTAYPVEYGHIFAVIFCNPQMWWIHAEHRPIFFRAVSWRWDNRKIVLLQLSQCQWTNPDYLSSREIYPEGWWKNPNHDKRRQESVPIFLITCCTFARRVTKFEFCCSKCLGFFFRNRNFEMSPLTCFQKSTVAPPTTRLWTATFWTWHHRCLEESPILIASKVLPWQSPICLHQPIAQPRVPKVSSVCPCLLKHIHVCTKWQTFCGFALMFA